MRTSESSLAASAWLAAALLLAAPAPRAQAAEDATTAERVDPAAWGSDHVGKPFPDYMTGDECLFCHRKIGPAWAENRHQLTIRPADPDDSPIKMLRQLPVGADLADATDYLMGTRRITRYLRRSKNYGKLHLLSTAFVPSKTDREAGAWKDSDSPQWDATTFGNHCAGCHATAVTAETRAFSAISLDCFTCHGDVALDHTKDLSRVLLSGRRKRPREIVSICGQCHLRGGNSKSSGRPYPNTFVAGDNLFRDFQVDFRDAAIEALPAADRHVFLAARDVAVFGRSETTCLTCHDVHGQNAEKHQLLDNVAICASCHVPGTDNARLRAALRPVNGHRAHSRVCNY